MMDAEQEAFTFRTWGGKRRGAGRKPREGLARVSHKHRPHVDSRQPQHVVLRVAEDVPHLRRLDLATELEKAIAAVNARGEMIVVHWSIQGSHLHMLNEAPSREALSNGMQRLAARIARAINRVLGRKGSVFADHYFARALRTPTEVRNCLAYVLDNREHHAPRSLVHAGIDPFSSIAGRATTFTPPRTWLLRVGWTRAGATLRPAVRRAVWTRHGLPQPD